MIWRKRRGRGGEVFWNPGADSEGNSLLEFELDGGDFVRWYELDL